jgi:ketosteroid isomerase-like protein
MRMFVLPAVAMLAIAGCATTTDTREALRSLVEAERAFARMSVERDVRTAFVANLADDGILFRPGPVRAREWFASQPPPADPKAVLLEWEPVASGVAASGDFGFTTGPSRASLRAGGKPPQHFVYFSVWKRDASGRWRVAIDAGVSVPDSVSAAELAPGPDVGRGISRTPDRDIEQLTTIERRAGDRGWLARHLAADALLLSDGSRPASGDAALHAAREEQSTRTLEPLGGEVARSADLAYTYGGWRSADRSGNYVHLWSRQSDGTWKIAVEVRFSL